MELSGKLKLILNEETFASGFNKRSFVIAVESNYPYDVCFDLLKDKVRMIDGFNTGDEIKVSFDIKSREYNGKWFTGATAWRVEKVGAGMSSSAPTSSGMSSPPPPAPMSADQLGPAGMEEDDLPF